MSPIHPPQPPRNIRNLIPRDTTSPIFTTIPKLQRAGCRVWTNSLCPSNNAGHDDERAVLDNPYSAWRWLIAQGTNILRPDRPHELLTYLQRLGRRPLLRENLLPPKHTPTRSDKKPRRTSQP